MTLWMPVATRPPLPALPGGFSLRARSDVAHEVHHLSRRSGDKVAERLSECSLHQPDLDLAAFDDQGQLAAYGPFWADPSTGVGLVGGLSDILTLAPSLAAVFSGRRVFLSPVVRPVERGAYWLMGVKEAEEQSWLRYAVAMLAVTVASLLFTYLVLRFQDRLPFNPQGFGPVAPDLAMNTAISFTTNTNWQNYTGEQTMSYFSQMVGLVMHNFLSAATGIALAVDLVRGISSRQMKTVGNFYVDATRATLYVLLPLSIGPEWMRVLGHFNPLYYLVTASTPLGADTFTGGATQLRMLWNSARSASGHAARSRRSLCFFSCHLSVCSAWRWTSGVSR